MRRTRSLLASFVAATAVLLTACGGAAEPELAASGGEPRPGGVVTIALPSYPAEGLNPHIRGALGFTHVMRNVYDSLVSIDFDQDFHPWLAESWEISPDGLRYTFQLRDDVTFTDGERFDAQAVKTNFDLVIDGEYAPGVKSSTFSNLQEVNVLSDFEVELVLDRPRSSFLHTLSSLQGAIVSPKGLAGPERDSGGTSLAGTGPFVLTEIVPDQQLRFVRNDDYNSPPVGTAQHEGPAHLDELVLTYLPEPAVRVGALTSGQVDAVSAVPISDVELFDGVDGFDYEYRLSNTQPVSLFFNVTSGPTQDLAVRRALREGFDADALLDAVYLGLAQRQWASVPAGSKYYDPKFEGSYGGDAELGNRLLDEAGWTGPRTADGIRTKDGEPLKVRYIGSPPTDRQDVLLQAIQAEWKKNLGVDLELQFRDEGTVDTIREANGYEIFAREIGGIDPGEVIEKTYQTGAAMNTVQLSDPAVDDLLLEIRAAGTDEDRKRLLTQLQDYAITEQALTHPLYYSRHSYAASSRVQNLATAFDPPRGYSYGYAYDLWLDQE
ncbi:ABC transporter substrate-binding protein [Pseudonocardia sp. NPDC046786]|uniref:ABC transporter substrate-binding protein n=1 Tax=Pseudonocardia sp. NPDC046786 TaxID=3155471 RepID=UPI0033D97414